MKKIIFKQMIFFLVVMILVFANLTYILNLSLIQNHIKDDVFEQIETRQLMFADICNTLFENIQSRAEALIYNEDIRFVAEQMQADAPLGVNAINDVYALQRTLNEVIYENANIESIYVHFVEEGYIVSSDFFFANIANFHDTQWVEQSASVIENGDNILPGTLHYEQPYSVVSGDYVRYIFEYDYYYSSSKILIVINCDDEIISDLVQSDASNETIMMNINQVPFFSNITNENNVQISNENMDEILSSAENTQIIGDTLVTRVQDEYGNIYIDFTDYAEATEKYNWLLFILLASISLLIVIVSIALYFYLLRVYSPINMAIKQIQKTSKLLKLEHAQDAKLLNEAVDKLIERVKDAETKKEEDRLFKNIVADKEVEITKFTKRYFATVVILEDDVKTNPISVDISQIQFTLCLSLLMETGTEIIGRMRNNNSYEFLLNFDDDKNLVELCKENDENRLVFSDNMIQVLDSIAKHITMTSDKTVTIGTSDVYERMSMLPIAYKEASERVSRRTILGKNSIITESDKTRVAYLPEKELNILISCIEKEDVEKLEKTIETLKYSIKEGIIELTSEQVQTFINYLCCGLIRYTSTLSIDCSISYDTILNLISYETLEDMLNYLKAEITKLINNKIQSGKDEMNTLRTVASYLQENYRKDIDVNTIAHDLNLSYSRLRKIVLDGCGLNVNDYINHKRISEAKKLITNSDKNIYEIAVEVGYNNEQSFARYFKKFEKITPGEYRKKSKIE